MLCVINSLAGQTDKKNDHRLAFSVGRFSIRWQHEYSSNSVPIVLRANSDLDSKNLRRRKAVVSKSDFLI
jgi:hypothetical protein